MAQAAETGIGRELRDGPHPLDPLSEDEVRDAVALVRETGRLSERARFATVALFEPEKELVLDHVPGAAIDRQVELIILDRPARAVYEAVVSVTKGRVCSWERAPESAQPMILWEEWEEAERIAKADPRFAEALRRRGIESSQYVYVDPVSAGNFDLPGEAGLRLIRGIVYWREDGRDNGYAHPVEGLVAVVDLNGGRLVDLWDVDDPPPLPAHHGRYDSDAVGPVRDDLKPLDVVQPEGPSFTVDGNAIAWQRWRLRVSMHSREGLVLHTVSYDGRPILHRASLSEMAVPYGDPARAHFFRAPLDVGEYGLGKMANELELGCDCLGEIVYLDAVQADERGAATIQRRVICLHEEDDGILWKHYDARSGETEVRRSRRLVVSCICTVGNYEYGFYWYLYQDGTIEHEIKATGIMHTQAVPDGELPEFGSLVAPNLGAMHHQHLFIYRLDFAVDGIRNTAFQVDTTALPISDENPYGNAMRPVATPIERESVARRRVDPASNRYWSVVNPNARNALGQPTAYKLMPGHTAAFLCDPQSATGRRARFASHNLWVTRCSPSERYAGGDYPNQSDPSGLDDIVAWQKADRSLVNEDIVVWYSLGTTHLPRPEDWPVMPVERIGFVLKPVGFFDANPALDVPPGSRSSRSRCVQEET